MPLKADLHITASLRNGITYLENCYATPPLKLANITEDKQSKQLQLMVMCSSPGILDGDNYTIKVSVNENASLQLHTQSYQRLFQMQHGATQQMTVHVASGATFMYLPHPAVPHAASIFKSTNHVYLQNNSTLIWGEIITCGRQLKAEVFTFSKYHNITHVYINNKLVIRENLLMQPSVNNLQELGLLEGYTHQASLIYLCNEANLTDKMDAIAELLSLQTNIEYGVSKTPVNGCIVRILGCKAEQLHGALKSVAKLLLAPNIVAAGCG